MIAIKLLQQTTYYIIGGGRCIAFISVPPDDKENVLCYPFHRQTFSH